MLVWKYRKILPGFAPGSHIEGLPALPIAIQIVLKMIWESVYKVNGPDSIQVIKSFFVESWQLELFATALKRGQSLGAQGKGCCSTYSLPCLGFLLALHWRKGRRWWQRKRPESWDSAVKEGCRALQTKMWCLTGCGREAAARKEG